MRNFLAILLQQDLLLRSEKIYSVLAVLGVIFFGVLVYLILTNRKVNELEKRMEELTADKSDKV